MEGLCEECKNSVPDNDEDKVTLLNKAIQSDHAACVKILLKTGADVKSMAMPLFHAAEGKDNCLEMLIKAGGVDVNTCDTFGRTTLMVAAAGGYIKCVNLLIKNGADVNKVLTSTGPLLYIQGSTALMLASKRGHSECVDKLTKAEADVNKQDKDGDTALMYAAEGGHSKCMEHLVKAGADVNMGDAYGDTALIMAAELGRDKCVEILLTSGADVNIRNSDRYTALDHAQEKGHNKCVKLIQKYAGEKNKVTFQVAEEKRPSTNTTSADMITLKDNNNTECCCCIS